MLTCSITWTIGGENTSWVYQITKAWRLRAGAVRVWWNAGHWLTSEIEILFRMSRWLRQRLLLFCSVYAVHNWAQLLLKRARGTGQSQCKSHTEIPIAHLLRYTATRQGSLLKILQQISADLKWLIFAVRLVFKSQPSTLGSRSKVVFPTVGRERKVQLEDELGKLQQWKLRKHCEYIFIKLMGSYDCLERKAPGSFRQSEEDVLSGWTLRNRLSPVDVKW